MVKAKTLTRQKKFSKNTPKLRLKKGVQLVRHDPFKVLLNEKIIAQAFWECLKDNDPEGAMEILNAHLNALHKAQLTEEVESFCSTSIKSKNPTLRTIAKFIHCNA